GRAVGLVEFGAGPRSPAPLDPGGALRRALCRWPRRLQPALCCARPRNSDHLAARTLRPGDLVAGIVSDVIRASYNGQVRSLREGRVAVVAQDFGGTRVDEISDGIFRISTPVASIAGGGITYNQYLLVDDQPLLFHTGKRAMFSQVREAIARVLPL